MDDKQFLAALTKNERRYLSKMVCMWCDHPMHRSGCSSAYKMCPSKTRIERAKKCLKEYKPRKKASQ